MKGIEMSGNLFGQDQVKNRPLEVAALNKWCEDKPLLFALIVAEMAAGVEGCQELLDMRRNGYGLVTKVRPLTFAEKCPFYDSSWKLVQSVVVEFGASESDAEELIDWLRKIFRRSKEDTAEIRRAIEPIQPGSFRDLSNKYRRHWDLPPRPDRKSRKTIDALRKAVS